MCVKFSHNQFNQTYKYLLRKSWRNRFVLCTTHRSNGIAIKYEKNDVNILIIKQVNFCLLIYNNVCNSVKRVNYYFTKQGQPKKRNQTISAFFTVIMLWNGNLATKKKVPDKIGRMERALLRLKDEIRNHETRKNTGFEDIATRIGKKKWN